jgi:Cu/Ag efflux protein CusF
MHDRVGMIGKLVVGAGGEPKRIAQAAAANAPALHRGTGVVIATTPRVGRLIVNHEEIKGYMAAMEMSFPVTPPSLLDDLKPGDRIDFTIDAAKSAIIAIEVKEKAK